MTPEEINEAVARKLGWVQCCNPKTMENGKIIDCFGWSRGGSHFHEAFPNYCRDIGAAWEVVEHVKANRMANGYAFQCDVYEFVGAAAGWYNTSGNLAWAESSTAPMAICLAFLKMP